MGNVSVYLLSSRVKDIIKNGVNCYYCHTEIKLGERVATKRGGSGKRRMYHYDCAVKLYLVDVSGYALE